MKRATDVFAVMTAVATIVAFACAPARAAGITGGGIASTLRGDDVTVGLNLDEARQSWAAGIYFSAKSPGFEFRPEVLFTNMGSGEGTILPAVSPGPLSFELTYIQVPFLFKLTSATEKRAGVGVFFGPYFAFNIDAEVTSDVGGVPTTANINNLVKDTDVGAIVGISIDAKNWSLDVRYTHGFEKIFEDTSLDVRNASLSVMLGIGF